MLLGSHVSSLLTTLFGQNFFIVKSHFRITDLKKAFMNSKQILNHCLPFNLSFFPQSQISVEIFIILKVNFIMVIDTLWVFCLLLVLENLPLLFLPVKYDSIF